MNIKGKQTTIQVPTLALKENKTSIKIKNKDTTNMDWLKRARISKLEEMGPKARKNYTNMTICTQMNSTYKKIITWALI